MDGLTLLGVVIGLWSILAVAMMLAWWIEQRTGNSGWVDVVWTCAMGASGVIGATAAFGGDALTNRQVLVAGLVFAWALRLAGHIARRTSNVTDDPRYAKLRNDWGADAPRNMFGLLQAQAFLSVPMVVAVVLGAWNPAALFTVTDWIAMALFCFALAGSAIADRQLTVFKQRADASGQICNSGVWAWSRHPNYFFEWLIWVSFAVFAINPSGNWSWGYIALVGPICMYWSLRYVSGVPPLEEHMVAKYGARYVAYQKTTSMFFPLPPHSVSKQA